MDVAQDLLLRELHRRGSLRGLVFKGGTSLRKLYAGNAGRFSLDLDFSVMDVGADPDDLILELVEQITDLSIGPFQYGATERRGEWSLTFASPFGDPGETLQSKLDVSPPPWLPPITHGWRSLPIHSAYGEPALPELNIIRLEENIAEKISRLNRATPARDMYDLGWIMTNQAITGELDIPLIRGLAVLKIWVDANGATAGETWWKPGHEGPSFDPKRWLRERGRDEFDEEDIGALAVPKPSGSEISAVIIAHFQFLSDLDDDERTSARALDRDRALALRMLAGLPGERMSGIGLY